MNQTALRALEKELWKRGKWKPHDLQREVMVAKARNKVFTAGRRAGKSQVGGMSLVPKAFSALEELDWLEAKRKQRRWWIIGPEYSDSEKEFRVLYDFLKTLGVPFDKPGTYNNPQMGDMHISLWGGKFMVDAMSAKHPETLVGEGLSGVVLSEAAKLKPSVYPKYVRPALADFNGSTYMGSTPEGRNWFYRAWQRGQDPLRPSWQSWRSPSWENPYIYRKQKAHGREADDRIAMILSAIAKRNMPSEYDSWQKFGKALGFDPEIIEMALDLPTELFKQEVGAEFNEFVGRVFKDFDEEIHVGDFNLDPTWQTYAALDYGFTNPLVWLLIQVDPHGENCRIIDEYYETGRTTEEAGREIRDRGLVPDSLMAMFPDPAEPDRSKALADMFHVPSRGGTGGAIKDRLDIIRKLLKPDPRIAHLDRDHEEWVPRVMINRRCKETIREWNVYRYPKSAEEAAEAGREAPEAPMKKDDHTPEAFGRFAMGFFGSQFIHNAPTRQRRARVGGSRPSRR